MLLAVVGEGRCAQSLGTWVRSESECTFSGACSAASQPLTTARITNMAEAVCLTHLLLLLLQMINKLKLAGPEEEEAVRREVQILSQLQVRLHCSARIARHISGRQQAAQHTSVRSGVNEVQICISTSPCCRYCEHGATGGPPDP